MSLKIKEEVLHAESLVGENTAQAVLQTTLDLSSTAPSIDRVVWLRGNAVVSGRSVSEDKVNLEGHIDLKLVYMSEDLEAHQVNYHVVPYRHGISFSDYVEIIGAEIGMSTRVKVDILGIEWEIQPDQRTVDVDVLVQYGARVKQKANYPVVTKASVQSPKKLGVDDGTLNLQSLLTQLDTSLALEQEQELPQGLSGINLVLDSEIKPRITETLVTQESISLTGQITNTLIYLDEDWNVTSYSGAKPIPFEITLPNETKSNELVVKPHLSAVFDLDFVPPSSTYKLVGELRCNVELYEMKHANVIFDLNCGGGCVVETRTELIKLDSLVNEKLQQSSAQGVVELSGSYPPIHEILHSWAQLQTLDYRIDDDKVFVEGSISLEIIYLAHSEEERKPLHGASFRNAIPFQHVIAIGGVQPGMVGDLNVEIVELRLDLINRETIEVDVGCQIDLKVTEPIQEEVVVEAVEIPQVEEDPPTITYVFAKNSDTLWKLSKLYHTSLDAILESNSWIREREEMKLLAGDRVCIPRKT